MKKGYYSILSYSEHIEDLVKPYKALTNPDSIIDKHFSKTLGENLEILLTFKSSKYKEIGEIFKSILSMKEKELAEMKRRHKNLDYFLSNSNKLVEIAIGIQKLLGEETELILPEYFYYQYEYISKYVTKKIFTFSKKGIPLGSEIKFLLDENLVAIVQGERTVYFEGQTYTITELKNKLYDRLGIKPMINKPFDGAHHFLYVSEIIAEMKSVARLGWKDKNKLN